MNNMNIADKLSKRNLARCKSFDADGDKFTVEIKELDLVFGGAFESYIEYPTKILTFTAMVLTVIDSIFNQVEIGNCECNYTADDIFDEIIDNMITSDSELISTFAIFFRYYSGAEGQYYIIIKGNKSEKEG